MLKKPKKNRQTKNRRRLIRETEKLWYELCLDEWGGLCNYCGNKHARQVHHFYRKSMYGHLRFDINNGVPTCQGCHIRADESNYIDIVKEKRGEEWYLDLKEKSLHPPQNYKGSVKWIKEERKCLTSIVN